VVAVLLASVALVAQQQIEADRAIATAAGEPSRAERAAVRRVAMSAVVVFVLGVGFAGSVVAWSARGVRMRRQEREAERMAHLHARAERLLDHVPVGVLVLGADGRVAEVHGTLRGRVGPDALYAGLGAAFPSAAPASIAALEARIDEALRSGRPAHTPSADLDLFGARGRFAVHAIPLDPPSPDAHLLLVIDDLTALASLQDQLVRAEKLSTIGELAAGIAHEVGTPLGVVRGRAEYALDALGADHPQSDGLRVIVEQIERITRTIRALLDFSRPSHRPEATASSVAAAARAVSDLVRLEAERRRVTVQIDVPDALRVHANPDQLQQVLVNLVMNALDACSGGGRVGVAARARGKVADLVVEDDGAGIAPEIVPRVFDPFFTTKKRGQGTGLGLAVVDRIVRDHGGTMAVESAPGKGTRFVVSWPVEG
jgi:signal transduction histidine kinase